MQAFLVSVGVTALAEFGDKTQLMALVLAAKYRRPLPILLGIALATAINHIFAGALGTWVAHLLGPLYLRVLLGVLLLGMGGWMLVPDTALPRSDAAPRLGVFGTSLVTFFLLEFGDKTQIATAALAARYMVLAPVVAGSVLGILLADVPAVLAGEALARRVPLGTIRTMAAALLGVLGVLVLAGFA